MSWRNIRLVLMRELRDQLRDRRTLFMITILPVLLYPMLGLGIVEMMLTFSEQQRVVVILNADELPELPALLDGERFADQWFPESREEASMLRVLAETQKLTGESEGSLSSQARRKPGQKSDEELLQAARTLAQKIQSVHGLPGSSVSKTDLVQSGGKQDRTELQKEISQLFGTSGFQVLVVIPPGYASSLTRMQEAIREESRSQSHEASDPQKTLPVLVIRNSADDKSVVAFSRVQQALRAWEDSVREKSFLSANLPPDLQHPARLAWIEVAREEQVAASVWSKLFPAMLVIMALTGAFYPAIDLGAGEKERGTMETLLISPARRIEVVLGKFGTIMVFSMLTALLNLLSMGITGQQMASVVGAGTRDMVSLEFPGFMPLLWLVILLIPLAALFSALCLALATFAKSTKEGQYYLTPLLMVVMGLTMFCLSPAVEMTPLYSVLPVVNVALLLKGLLLNAPGSENLIVYAVPVLISSIGYSMLAIWWAIELYNSEDVLFREAEKFDLKMWLRQMLRTKDAVPAFPEAGFCFILIVMLQFVAMSYMKPDLSGPDPGRSMMQLIVVQQLTMIACPAVFMGVLLTTSLRATFRLRAPSIQAMCIAAGLALVIHPLSVELSQFLVDHRVFPELPESARTVMAMMKSGEKPAWLMIMVFAVTPAICEELAFRGFILSGLARGGRLAIAVGISSLMFGIIHMIPQQAFNAALLGMVLGLLAIYSRSLFPAIAFHFCNNAIATLHASESGRLTADGVFFSRDLDGILRYEAPLLILCAVAGSLMILHMIRIVNRDQDLKRRGLIASYGESQPLESNA